MSAAKENIKSIFGHAMGLSSPQERAAYLQQACAGDPALQAEIESLLQADRQAGSFLGERQPCPVATVDDPIGERPGTVIGPYKLLQQIGEGGMGAVFMAEQDQPIRRKVALKIIKPGMDSRQVIARFEAERQALAMMDHQNIAKVYDGGTTASGRPYFVMELVHGVPITQFCDDRKLTPRQRLDLFVHVCQALQHAHQKGIIHRDIKPSNVLVTMYDDKPVPKVIDFGVAKAIEHRLTDKTMFTQFGALIGTFEYMSPEQAEMNAFGVDTRSDIYALGVLLYELLTGTTPLERQRLRDAALDEMVRLIKEEESPRPSVRLSSSDSLPKIAAARSTEPAQLSKMIRGDIDWIVMKCLEKDRTRRYESANSLARDIQRHLADEPVEACPPSAAYKLRKFARKYRTPLRVAGVFLVLLILGVIVSTWQAIRATIAERAAWKNEQAAQEQKREADEAKEQAETRSNELAKLNDTLLRANYISDMNIARVAWDENNLARGRELLGKHRPHPGEKDRRGFEWHYLNRLFQGHELVIKAYVGPVTAIAFTPDGKRLICSGLSHPPGSMRYLSEREAKGQMKQWDATTGQPVYFQLKGQTGRSETLPVFGDRVLQIALSQDGKRIAASSWGDTIRVWDFAADKLTVLEGPEKHSNFRVKFSPDGQRLLSLHYPDELDSPDLLRVWDLTARKAIVTLNQLPHTVGVPSFSPDGRHFAVCCSDLGVVKVWNAATGAEAYSCSYAGGHVYSAAFSPDGKRLAASGRNGVQIWDTATHRAVSAWSSDAHEVRGLTFSLDGKRLAAGSSEGIVEVWDTQTGQRVHTFKGHAGGVENLAFSPDGARLVTGGRDGTLRFWDTTKQRSAISIPKMDAKFISYFPQLSPDGQTVQMHSVGDGKTIRLWNTETGEPRGGPIQLAKRAVDRTWTADSKRLYQQDLGGNVTVVDVATGKVVRTFQLDVDPKYAGFVLSPDEKWYAHTAGPMGRTIKVRNARTHAEFRSLKGFGGGFLTFSPDGSRLFGDGGDGVVKIWDIESERAIAATKLTGIFYSWIKFSPDGKRLAVVGAHNQLGTGAVRILDSDSLREVWSLQGHTLYVTGVEFSPDGQRLATASDDQTIRLWDLTAGQEVLKLSIPSKTVSLRFVSGGRRLMGASFDREIRVWDATPLPE